MERWVTPWSVTLMIWAAVLLTGGVLAQAAPESAGEGEARWVAAKGSKNGPRRRGRAKTKAKSKANTTSGEKDPKKPGKEDPLFVTKAAGNCELCHTVRGWTVVDYPRHNETRFPLRGEHKKAPCLGCHNKGQWARAVELATCSACHRDAHAGRLGAYCEGCHDENGWENAFNADAHRNSNFPLAGAHALVPCWECHQTPEPRQFQGVTTQCNVCHGPQFVSAALTSVDHVASNFVGNCETCHSFWQFSPARFPEHDICFQISGGPHGRIGCDRCHANVAGLVANNTCATLNAECTNCHRHLQPVTDQEHENVDGYQYKDRKCYECHRFAAPLP